MRDGVSPSADGESENDVRLDVARTDVTRIDVTSLDTASDDEISPGR